MTIKRKNLSLAVVMLAVALMPFTAQATNFTWTGGGSGANAGVWTYGSSPYNWSGGSASNGRYPGQTHTSYTDTATINSATNGQVTLGASMTLGGSATALTIGSSALTNALTVNSGGNLGMKGDVSNLKNITINTGGALTNADATAHNLSGAGGTVTLAGGSIASSGGGGWNLNQAVSGYGTVSAPLTNNNSLTANNATALTLSGGVNNSGTGILTAASGGTMSLTSALTNSGTANVASGGTLILGTGASLSGNAVNVNGTVTNNTAAIQALSQFVLLGGTLNGSQGYNNGTTWGGNGTIQKLTNTGTVNANNSGTPLTLTGITTNTGGTLGSTGGSMVNSGTINGYGTISAPLTNNGTVNSNVGGQTLRITGNVNNTGGLLNSTVTGATPSILSLEGAILGGTVGGGAIGEIDLNGATLTGVTFSASNYTGATPGVIKLTGDSTLSGAININNYVPISVNGKTLNLSGVTLGGVSGGPASIVVGSGTLNNSAASTITIGSISPITLAGGKITSTGGGSIQGGNINGWGTISASLTPTGSGAVTQASGSGKTLSITGNVNLNNGNLLSSTGATLDLQSTVSGGAGGYINPNGGTVNLNGATLNGLITMRGGAVNVTNNSTIGSGTVNAESTIGINSGKVLNVTGATLNLVTNGAFHGSLTNNGTLTLDTASLNNNSGATVTNNGTVNVHNSTVNWGNLNNNGAIISDPSTQIFNNLTVGAAGYLTGAAGDVFKITGNFVNNSAQNSAWNTLQAALAFATGTSSTHSVALGGADLGQTSAGFTNNFAWNSLDLTGQTLTLTDGNATPGGALYVEDLTGLTFSGSTVTDITGNGLNIYYDPNVDVALAGKTFNLEGGGILAPDTAPVPEPGTMMLLGFGFLGLAVFGKRFKRV